MSTLPNKYDGQQNIIINNNSNNITALQIDVSNLQTNLGNNSTAINTKVTKGGDAISMSLKIGTNDPNDFVLKSNNTDRLIITDTGKISVVDPSYINLVTANNDIPHKLYVDTEILAQTLDEHSNVNVASAVLGDRLEYNGNEWVPNRFIAGQCYWENNLVAENGGADVTVPIKLSGSATIGNNLFNVTHTSPNRLTIGTFVGEQYLVRISWQISFNTSDNDRSYLCYIRKNNNVNIPESKMTIVAKNNVNGSSNGSSSFLHIVNPNDFFELWVSPLNQFSGVTVQYLSMNIESIKRVS